MELLHFESSTQITKGIAASAGTLREAFADPAVAPVGRLVRPGWLVPAGKVRAPMSLIFFAPGRWN